MGGNSDVPAFCFGESVGVDLAITTDYGVAALRNMHPGVGVLAVKYNENGAP